MIYSVKDGSGDGIGWCYDDGEGEGDGWGVGAGSSSGLSGHIYLSTGNVHVPDHGKYIGSGHYQAACSAKGKGEG